MKKILQLIVMLTLLFANSYGQTIVLSENFTAYDGTAGTIPANWSLSYTGSGSFYTSTTSSGPSGPNSYKFGIDSTTVITPQFTGADSLHFWLRGNLVDSASFFTVYYSTDTVNFNVLDTIYPPNNQSVFYHYSLPAGAKQVKFMYHKSAGNIAFDDFSVTANNNVGIKNISKNGQPFSVYPSPSNGPVQISFDEPVNKIKISVYNMIGGEVKNIPVEKINDQKFNLNFRNQQPGFYFIRIQTDKFNYTTRITITVALPQKRINVDA
ncbi:MAG: T9SS type A sorting domain-containing protein [Bacteroidia bacterium]